MDSVDKILLEREKLEKNLFWNKLMQEIGERLSADRNICSDHMKAPLEDLRFYQGKVAAWKEFFELPDILMREIAEGIKTL
jgi:hypothetical protein